MSWGPHEAVNELYQMYANDIYRFAHIELRNSQAAETVKILQCTEVRVRVTLHRALRRLRNLAVDGSLQGGVQDVH